MSEQDADPISFSLYEWICKWAIESGLIMVWAFTCMQWNCMGRSVNIAPLGLHNLSCKEAADSIVIHYDSNKKDQTGENTSPKNCYANPFNPFVCMFLALHRCISKYVLIYVCGMYLCIVLQFEAPVDRIVPRNLNH